MPHVPFLAVAIRLTMKQPPERVNFSKQRFAYWNGRPGSDDIGFVTETVLVATRDWG